MKILLDNMSDMTYIYNMDPKDKPLVWLQREIKSPPFSKDARLEAGFFADEE